jgi:hypothetical protein
VAGIEAACTVLFDDPLFGLIALGGEVTQASALIGVVPRDGVRQRFHVVFGGRRLHLALDRDGFAAEQPVQVAPALDRFALVPECRSPSPHDAALSVEGLPPGRYSASIGTFVRTVQAAEKGVTGIQFPVRPGPPNPLRVEPAAEP